MPAINQASIDAVNTAMPALCAATAGWPTVTYPHNSAVVWTHPTHPVEVAVFDGHVSVTIEGHVSMITADRPHTATLDMFDRYVTMMVVGLINILDMPAAGRAKSAC